MAERREPEDDQPKRSDPFALDGQVAVVTGACGLLGREFCDALAAAGAQVVVADLDELSAHKLATRLRESYGRETAALSVDVTSKDSVVALKDRIVDKFGRIDVLVNSAADKDQFDEGQGAETLAFENYSLAAWQRSLDINLTGTFLTCQTLGAQMAADGHGSIINIGSTYGLTAPDQGIYKRPDGTQHFFKSAGYPASKGGVVMLTRFVATYWGHAGVRANILCPGGVAQGQDEHFVRNYSARTPLGRMAEASELRGAAVYLASEASRYQTGSVLAVDGGWTAW